MKIINTIKGIDSFLQKIPWKVELLGYVGSIIIRLNWMPRIF